MQKERIVGKPVFRKEGVAKVCGTAHYIDDFSLPGMIFGATVRSAIPRGRIVNIEFGPGIPWDEFTVVTAKDIPGKNYIALINQDWPCLADGFVNHPQEPILLLAHPDRHLLPLAVAAVRIEYEELPSVHSIEESELQQTIVWGEDNLFKSYVMERGDVDAAFAPPDIVIVEGEYSTGAQEHLYIENNGAIAVYSERDGVTLWGSLQCPFYAHKSLLGVTGLPEDKVRVIQVETGGAFGGKEDYPSMIGAHTVLLAMKSGRPVKIIYDRMEDMAATTKRHPSRARHRTAVTKDGNLVADGYRVLSRRRSVLDALFYGALARHDPLGRSLLLAEYSRAVEGVCDQHAAARGLSRIWSAAESVCDGAPHGSRGEGSGADSRGVSAAQSAAHRRDDEHRARDSAADRS